MSLLTTKTARSITYLCCIGGLLAVNALLVVVLWNNVFRDPSSSTPELSFLEGAGLTAFAYVVIFAVRYGVQFTPKRKSDSPKSSPMAEVELEEHRNQRFSHLTPEQRHAIKAELVRSCGCQEKVTKS